MGRPAQGWKLRQHGAIWYARFTLHGHRYELSTGERNRERAAPVAARLYAEAQRRGAPRVRRRIGGGDSLAEAAEQWLISQASVLGPRTIATYATHFEASIAPFFRGISRVTTANCERYIEMRLTKVRRQSLTKELSALRGLLRWRLGAGAPVVPDPPRGAIGTANKKARLRGPVDLTPDEVRRLLAALPARGYAGAPVRAWFTVLYETGLRPSTIDQLSVPEHYSPGRAALDIPPELDKARLEREVPLSLRARRALDRVCPKKGIVFGKHDYREHLKAAAATALPPDRAAKFAGTHLRSARITHWCEVTQNLAGVQHLAGHKHYSTTAIYVKPSARAAREVIKDAARRRR